MKNDASETRLLVEMWSSEQHGDNLIVRMWEKDGYTVSKKIPLSDLPNDLVSLDDLKVLGINHIDAMAVSQK